MEPNVRRLTEEPAATPFPLLRHPEWAERWPWLVQGITAAGPEKAWDLSLFGAAPAGAVLQRWDALGRVLPVSGIAHARQVHGTSIHVHRHGVEGLHLAPECDGHLTAAAGLLLAVSVADCVPVYVVAPTVPAVGLVHAGWRGAAEGILESALANFSDRLGASPEGLCVHLGPSICGTCYEVGPEVHRALGEPVPSHPEPVDLAGNLVRRALAAGVPASAVTRSTLCTRCGDADLFSHRGGDAGRQMALIGLAADP